MLKGIIFDVDGTLIDSNKAHAKAWAASMKANGIDADEAHVRRFIGMGGDNLLPAAVGIDKESEKGKAISEKREAIFAEQYLPYLKPFPDAIELMQMLYDLDLKIVLATSAKKMEADKTISLLHIDAYIDTIVTGDDVDNSKPDPDIISTALDKCGLLPNEAIMVGDTPYDLEAAEKCGLRFIGVLSGGWTVNDFPDAYAVYKSLADLRDSLVMPARSGR